MTHLDRYGKAYLVGIIFVLVTIANAIYGEFDQIKPEEMKTWGTFTWFLHWDSVVVAAGTTLLAFLNPTATNAQQANKTEVSSDKTIATK